MTNGYVVMRNRARELRTEQTDAEQRLWKALSNRQCGGLRFLRQRVKGQYILDFYCPALHLGIEVDGGIHDLPEIQERDAAREEGIRLDSDIRIIRFTNAEILQGTPEQWYTRILQSSPSRVKHPCPSASEGF